MVFGFVNRLKANAKLRLNFPIIFQHWPKMKWRIIKQPILSVKECDALFFKSESGKIVNGELNIMKCEQKVSTIRDSKITIIHFETFQLPLRNAA